MEGWEMGAFQISTRSVTKEDLNKNDKLTDYSGELAVVFNEYNVDLAATTMFFSAPQPYLRCCASAKLQSCIG